MNTDEPRELLHPDEWDRLYAERRRLKGIARGDRSPEDQMALEAVDAAIEANNHPGDPLAPFGGLPVEWTKAGQAGSILGAYRAFRASKEFRQRWLFFSLVSNALLLFGVEFFLSHFRIPGVNDLGLGCVVLLLAAWAVLTLERRQRRRDCAALRVHSTAAASQHEDKSVAEPLVDGALAGSCVSALPALPADTASENVIVQRSGRG